MFTPTCRGRSRRQKKKKRLHLCVCVSMCTLKGSTARVFCFQTQKPLRQQSTLHKKKLLEIFRLRLSPSWALQSAFCFRGSSSAQAIDAQAKWTQPNHRHLGSQISACDLPLVCMSAFIRVSSLRSIQGFSRAGFRSDRSFWQMEAVGEASAARSVPTFARVACSTICAVPPERPHRMMTKMPSHDDRQEPNTTATRLS